MHEREPEAWEQLGRRLFRMAYTLFLHRGWDPEQAYARAQEAAQDACFSIYCQVYPYDCPFDGWVFAILRHYVFRSHHRPRNLLDLPGVIDSLEKRPEKANNLTDFTAIERYEPLLCALGKLRSTAQRQVIECLFFQELSPAETAQKLDKTIQVAWTVEALHDAPGHLSAVITISKGYIRNVLFPQTLAWARSGESVEPLPTHFPLMDRLLEDSPWLVSVEILREQGVPPGSESWHLQVSLAGPTPPAGIQIHVTNGREERTAVVNEEGVAFFRFDFLPDYRRDGLARETATGLGRAESCRQDTVALCLT